jgi:hypothetical protein
LEGGNIHTPADCYPPPSWWSTAQVAGCLAFASSFARVFFCLSGRQWLAAAAAEDLNSKWRQRRNCGLPSMRGSGGWKGGTRTLDERIWYFGSGYDGAEKRFWAGSQVRPVCPRIFTFFDFFLGQTGLTWKEAERGAGEEERR